jgi:hypothetical protein
MRISGEKRRDQVLAYNWAFGRHVCAIEKRLVSYLAAVYPTDCTGVCVA